MLDKLQFNRIICKSEKKFFLNQKKNIKFVKKISVYLKYRRSRLYIHQKLQEYWHIFMRFESLFGRLPKINTLKHVRKGKLKKKIIFLRAFLVVKSSSMSEKKISGILDYIFNLHNYLYIKFLLNKKLKIYKFEEIINHFTNKSVYIQHGSIMFENNLYFKWLDISRNFININEINSMIYEKNYSPFFHLKTLKYYDSKLVIHSNYLKFFMQPFKILIKNYRKLVLFLFKKYRTRKKKNEKAHILL